MSNYTTLVEILKDMEKVAKALNVEPFEIYFLGGSACILGEYTDRATRDFDFIDINYPATYGRVLRYLSDFDMLEYSSTLLAPSYKDRAKRLEDFQYLKIFVLSREDIIVSKIVRMEQKDIEDMDLMINCCSKDTLNKIIQEILDRKDLFESKRECFMEKLVIFRERYNV